MNEMAYPGAGAGLTDLLAKVEDLRPLVVGDRHALARGPDLPRALADAFLRAGLGRLWAPREYGGAELEPADYLQVSEALSKLDGSLGWCAGISAGSVRLLGMIKTDATSSLSPDHALAASGGFVPKGTATRDGSGWRVQGHWNVMSLSQYSTLFMLTCIEQGTPSAGPTLGGPPRMRCVAVPREDLEIHSTWDASGLRSTGSHDVICKDVWVPDGRSVDCTGLQLPRVPGRPLYDMPALSAAAIALMAVPLGIAEASIEAFVALSHNKVASFDTLPLNEKESVQLTLGRSKAHLSSARTYVHSAANGIWAALCEGRHPTVEEQVELRLACWNAGDVGKRVVSDMYYMAGINVIPEDSLLAGQFRDVHVVAQHINFADRHLVTPGKVVLGMDPQTTLI
jgi:indole-3-acetate monooxygenase